ncbi:MAG: hypothetical protein LBV41_11070 [Cytophagaceae bacterium]|jgi:hypothetical protein|nr:hypothetical protein [Cytophagaceae bacterium]
MKDIIDQLLIDVYVIKAKQRVTNEMLLSVFSEMLPEESYKNLYSNFIDENDKAIRDALTEIEPFLYNPSKLVKEKFNLFSATSEAKRSQNYIASEKNIPE